MYRTLHQVLKVSTIKVLIPLYYSSNHCLWLVVLVVAWSGTTKT